MEEFQVIREEMCFGCGKVGFFILYTPCRCHDCFKNKIPVGTSPVKDAYFLITEKSLTKL